MSWIDELSIAYDKYMNSQEKNKKKKIYTDPFVVEQTLLSESDNSQTISTHPDIRIERGFSDKISLISGIMELMGICRTSYEKYAQSNDAILGMASGPLSEENKKAKYREDPDLTHFNDHQLNVLAQKIADDIQASEPALADALRSNGAKY